MRFTYCPHCGTKLIRKEIGDEGMIPYCENCSVPLWDMFTTSIIAAVVNEYDEVALLQQSYVSSSKYVCSFGKKRSIPSYATQIFLASSLSNLLVTPAKPFCSWRRIGLPV